MVDGEVAQAFKLNEQGEKDEETARLTEGIRGERKNGRRGRKKRENCAVVAVKHMKRGVGLAFLIRGRAGVSGVMFQSFRFELDCTSCTA